MLIKDRHSFESIVDSIDRINEYISGFSSADAFNDDYRSFDATMMHFVIIGEMVDKLSKEIKIRHDSVNWIKIKDFRNIVAHDYFGIDAEEIWQIIKNDLPELRINIQRILEEID